jgi:pimeloyl-ACP methyl ester carboxylesterase
MKRAILYGVLLSFALACVFFIAGQANASKEPRMRAAAGGPPPKISWSPCYKEWGKELGLSFECGTVQVPLDYFNPGAAAVSIALVRVPATDQANKIGTLFFNPGGPGGSGVDLVLSSYPYFYSEEVRARFDIVGFDPRGVARSTALRCYGNYKQWPAYPFVFPMTPEEEAIWGQADSSLAGACDQRGTKLYDHMATANAARDLDLLRQAVGDDKLNYVGYSYGTFLGMNYVNLFPDKVRAVVLDGNIDPIGWSTGEGNQSSTLPFSTRIRSAAGAQATLLEFFRLCDEGDSPFKGENPGDTEEMFAAMAAKLRAEPLVITMPDGFTYTFTYADLIGTVWGALYSSYSWPNLAQFLADLEALLPADSLGLSLYKLWVAQGFVTKRGFPHYYNWMEGFPAVACADSDNPSFFEAWAAAAAQSEAEDGYLGPAWTWASSICLPWEGEKDDRYVGPWNATTANPVLIANTMYDPATRYEGALLNHSLLANSGLLTVHGWGHCTWGFSYDADMAVSEYLLRGTLPPENLVYEQDYVPFKVETTGLSRSAMAREARMRLTIMTVPDAVRNTVKGKNKE